MSVRQRQEIQILLRINGSKGMDLAVGIKLGDGARILRLSEPESGLCLEKRLEPKESVARQKQRWKQAFLVVLERELGATG